jgi:4a-hydroxytetrahydrobiopterin dehydratase
MPPETSASLASKHCVPCEGGVARYTATQAADQLALLPGWRLTHDGTRIRRDYMFEHFRDAMTFLQTVAVQAEEEQHHPDLHLECYRNVWIEIFTHAIGGLSENDFILAARIDAEASKFSPKQTA